MEEEIANWEASLKGRPFFEGNATIRLTPPKDARVLAKALWTAVATAGPWTSGPVYRYHAAAAVAAAWEGLGAAIRASGPVRHGWTSPQQTTHCEDCLATAPDTNVPSDWVFDELDATYRCGYCAAERAL